MDLVQGLFDRLDDWRHLPSYQLERRADIFFSLYLVEALEEKFASAVHPIIVPEFPVHKGSIRDGQGSNESFKIDYLAISQARDVAYFVELKTDIGSRRGERDRYLHDAAAAGLPRLLEGLKKIFAATSEKRKYLHLLRKLEELGLIALPASMDDGIKRGVTAASREIDILSPPMRCEVVYVQPTGDGDADINFTQFHSIVAKHTDPLSRRFAESLSAWSERADSADAR